MKNNPSRRRWYDASAHSRSFFNSAPINGEVGNDTGEMRANISAQSPGGTVLRGALCIRHLPAQFLITYGCKISSQWVVVDRNCTKCTFIVRSKSIKFSIWSSLNPPSFLDHLFIRRDRSLLVDRNLNNVENWSSEFTCRLHSTKDFTVEPGAESVLRREAMQVSLAGMPLISIWLRLQPSCRKIELISNESNAASGSWIPP